MDVIEMRRRVTDDDVAALVERFYARVRDDPLLGPVFASRIEPAAWPAHLARMRDFWSTVLLGAGRYHGDPMAAHRAVPGLGRTHFARWLACFEEVAGEVLARDVAAAVVRRAQRMGANLTAGLPRRS